MWILLIAFLNLIQGCHYYYKVTRAKEPSASTVLKLQDEKRYIILHHDNQAWHFTGITADENNVKGRIEIFKGHTKYKTTDSENVNRYKKSNKIDESEVLQEVHIYASELLYSNAPTVSVPINAINKIDIYDPAKGATTTSWILGGIGYTVGAAAVVAIIVALTKSSCPFIYVSDKQSEQFIGEIYSGAIYPSLERNDYLPLPEATPGQKEYIIRMANEVHEIQHTNLIELKVFDHPEGIKVLLDKYGNYLTFSNLQLPVKATNLKGMDIAGVLQNKDTLAYVGAYNENNESNADGVILSFSRPLNVTQAKLIIKAKTSFWLDYVFTRFHQLFGKEYTCWVEKQKTVPASKMIKWNKEQNIPISVYIEKNGKWKYVDYFNIVGPMAAKEDALLVDLEGITSDTVKLKMEYGYMFWELDYAAIDYSDNINLTPKIAKFESAVDNKKQNVMELLARIDTLYYVQPEIGDEVVMKFTLPKPENEEQTLIMHSKGYYQIIMNLTGKEQVNDLLTFRKKGRFPAFSNEILKEQYSISKN